MIKFKDVKTKYQFLELHPKLIQIIADLHCYCLYEYGVDITITSMLRPGDKGVHGDARGCDVRSWDFTPEQIAVIKFKFNEKYPYGDGIHPTCLYHDVGQGKHFHFQVKRDGKT